MPMKIAVHYLLSTVGRRALLLTGENTNRVQTVEVVLGESPEFPEFAARAVFRDDKSPAHVYVGFEPGKDGPERIIVGYDEASDYSSNVYPKQGFVEFDTAQTPASLLAWLQEAETRIAAEKQAAEKKVAENFTRDQDEKEKQKAEREARRQVRARESYLEAVERGKKTLQDDGTLAPRSVSALEAFLSAPVPKQFTRDDHWIDSRSVECDAVNDVVAAVAHEAREARKAQEKARMVAWVQKHGSERLRACIAEGFECGAIYKDERKAWILDMLAKTLPGWRVASDVAGDESDEPDPRNPTEEALDLLAQGRRVDPNAKLLYWTVQHEHCWLDPDETECKDQDEDGDCPAYDWTGYMVSAIWSIPGEEDRKIRIYLGTAPVIDD